MNVINVFRDYGAFCVNVHCLSLPNPVLTEDPLKILQFLLWHSIAELLLWLFSFISVSDVFYSDNIFTALNIGSFCDRCAQCII
jgi:hypothetical protein